MNFSPSVDRGLTLRIGIFAAAALALFGGALWVLGGKSGLFQANYRLIAEFETVQGLKVGQPVWLNGLDIGLVEAISLNQNRPGRIQVVLLINQDFQPYVRNDSRAFLESKGLLGDKIVNLSLGTADAEPLRDGEQITSVPPSDFADILNEAGRMMTTIKSVLENIEALVADISQGQGTVGKLLRNDILHDQAVSAVRRVNTMLGHINNGTGTIGKLVISPELYNRVEAIAVDAEAIVADIKTLTAKVQRGEGNLGRLLAEDGLYAQLDSAATSLAVVLAAIERAEGSTGQVLMTDSLHSRMVTMVESLDTLIKDVKENPDRYFNVSVFGGRRK